MAPSIISGFRLIEFKILLFIRAFYLKFIKLRYNCFEKQGVIMNTTIVGRHIKIDDDTKKFINNTSANFQKYHLDIISVNSIVSKDEAQKTSVISFEFVINVANLDTIVIKQKDKDLHKAIEVAAQRVAKILRRHHDKITSHDATKLSKAFEEKAQDDIDK